MSVRALIEAESPKEVFKKIRATPRTYQPRKLTWDEIERLSTIMSMGPVRRKPSDQKFIDWGYVELYDPEDPNYIDAKADLASAVYDKNGGVRDEWLAEPSRLRGRIRRYYWPQEAEENPKHVFKKAVAATPRPTSEVASSGGTFTVDSLNGEVRQWQPYDGEDRDYQGYDTIRRFDLEEWRRYWAWEGELPLGYDILDLGFWTQNYDYVPPDGTWREEVRDMSANLPERVVQRE